MSFEGLVGSCSCEIAAGSLVNTDSTSLRRRVNMTVPFVKLECSETKRMFGTGGTLLGGNADWFASRLRTRLESMPQSAQSAGDNSIRSRFRCTLYGCDMNSWV